LVYHRVGQELLSEIGFFGIAWMDISRVWGSWLIVGCSKLAVMVSLVFLGLGSQIKNGWWFSRFLREVLRFCFAMLGKSC
jgi:hypothetical protein